MNSDLIFDVGMHNGDDTAYYLQRGYRVVAIEADPDLVDQCRKRFAGEIERRRLKIINLAIAAERGEADFWICEDLRIWNSFDKSMASRKGYSCHSIKVQTVPLREVFAEHGVPHYLKLDIEGHDHIAAADILPKDPPRFVSLEISSVDDFYLLRAKGYRRFKCIQQGCFKPIASPRLSFGSLLEVAAIRLKTTRFANRLRAKYRAAFPQRSSVPQPGTWAFAPGSSGPFGDETPGEWLPFENVLHAWLSHQLGHRLGYFPKTLDTSGAWFDLHARID